MLWKEQTIAGTLISRTVAAAAACLIGVLLVGLCLDQQVMIDPRDRDAETHTFPTRLLAALQAALSSQPDASLTHRGVPKMTGSWPSNNNRSLIFICFVSPKFQGLLSPVSAQQWASDERQGRVWSWLKERTTYWWFWIVRFVIFISPQGSLSWTRWPRNSFKCCRQGAVAWQQEWHKQQQQQQLV